MPLAKEPVLSVIIPCLNNAETLTAQLEALAGQEWSEPWELIVVDGGSSDGTLDILGRYRDRLPLRVVGSERRGIAYARNVGAREARAPALAYCDADDEVADGWLTAIAAGLEQHEFVSSRVDVTKLNPDWLRDYRPHTESNELPRVPFPPFMRYPATCALGIRMSLYRAVGGFDEDFHLADDEIGFRVQLAGKELLLLPDAIVHYRHRDRLRDIYRQARIYARDWAAFQKLYADPGFQVTRRRWLFQGWRWILRALPGARNRAGRARLAWMLGWQAGRYRGSFLHGVRSIS